MRSEVACGALDPLPGPQQGTVNLTLTVELARPLVPEALPWETQHFTATNCLMNSRQGRVSYERVLVSLFLGHGRPSSDRGLARCLWRCVPPASAGRDASTPPDEFSVIYLAARPSENVGKLVCGSSRCELWVRIRRGLARLWCGKLAVLGGLGGELECDPGSYRDSYSGSCLGLPST